MNGLIETFQGKSPEERAYKIIKMHEQARELSPQTEAAFAHWITAPTNAPGVEAAMRRLFDEICSNL